jgi:hypothetical protein
VCITISGGFNDDDISIRGTYLHSKLIPHVASWISFAFGYKVSCIVENFAITLELEAKQIELQQVENRLEFEQVHRQNAEHWAIQEKQRREVSDRLLNLSEEQIVIFKKELEVADEQVKVKDEQLEQTAGDLQHKTNCLTAAYANINGKNQQIAEERKNLAAISSTHEFGIYKIDGDDDEAHDERAPGDYYTIRRRRCDMKDAEKKFYKKFPKAHNIYYLSNSANGINLFQRLKKQRLGNQKVIRAFQNYFNIMTSEQDVIARLHEMKADAVRPALVNISQ